MSFLWCKMGHPAKTATTLLTCDQAGTPDRQFLPATKKKTGTPDRRLQHRITPAKEASNANCEISNDKHNSFTSRSGTLHVRHMKYRNIKKTGRTRRNF